MTELPIKSEAKAKLPWRWRWVIAKSLVMRGKLPHDWQELAEIYQVEKTKENTFLRNNGKQRPITAKTIRQAIEQRHQENWGFWEERNLWREALRMEWLKLAPSSKVRQVAKTMWQERVTSKQADLAWTGWQPTQAEGGGAFTVATVANLTTKEKDWLLGWIIAIPQSSITNKSLAGSEGKVATPEVKEPPRSAKDYWLAHPITQLTPELATVEWATVFNQNEVVGEILDQHPEQLKQKTKENGAIYQAAREAIKQQKLSFELQYIESQGNLLGLYYQAVWWGANHTLREVCLRGGGALQYQNLVGEKVAFQRALEMSNRDGMETLLGFEPITRTVSKREGCSPIGKFVGMFPPGLDPESRDEYLVTFNKTLDACLLHPNLKYPISLEQEWMQAIFATVEKRREPRLLQALLTHFCQQFPPASLGTYQRTFNTKHPGFDIKKQRKKVSLIDQCLDEGSDEYLAQVMEHSQQMTVNDQTFYSVMLCSPHALAATMARMTSAEIQKTLSYLPEPLADNYNFDVNDQNITRPAWIENDDLWDVIFKSRKPSVVLQTLKDAPEFRQKLTPETWQRCWNQAFRLTNEEMVPTINVLTKMSQQLQVKREGLACLTGLTNLLKKDRRNLKAIEELASKQQIPWAHPVDEFGNTLVHRIIETQDKALFELVLTNKVSFETPNLAGTTPYGLARKEAPEMYQTLVKNMKVTMESQMPTNNSEKPNNHKTRL